MLYNSEELTKPFPKDYGVGLQFKDDENILYETVCTRYPRIIYSSITSFKGFSPGAIHYYARLTNHGLPFKILKLPNKKKKDSWDHKVVDVVSISGSFTKFVPEEARSFDVLIRRKLTKKELGSRRFENYEPGDYTECFNTRNTLKRHMVKHFKRLFGDGWALSDELF